MRQDYLVLKGLGKIFGTGEVAVTAVNNITIEVKEGELVTLLGPSGCGKTTTLRMIAGFELPTSGNVLIDAEDVTMTPANRRPTTMVFQNYALFPHLTVFENIAYGLKIHGDSGQKIGRKVGEIMRLVGLEGLNERSPGNLSGGQQQRVALARAMVMEPKVLLFDEPLSNLDAKLRIKMRIFIRKIQQELSITSVYVTHDQEEAMTLSDRIVVMNQGMIEQVGAPEEIYARPRSKFVADFIGKTTNFLTGEVVEKDATIVKVKVWEKVLAFERPDSFSRGDKVLLVVRPEMIDLAAREGMFEGEVNLVTYLGSEVIYEITSHQQLFTVEVSHPLRQGTYQRGNKVFMNLDLKNIYLIKE
jgi:iron(III) transport system ATP-binding protein